MNDVFKDGIAISVLGNSFVRYVDHHGTDLDIVNAARISYKGESKGEEKDKKLLRYLFKNKHTSPFEMVSMKFNIRMPIFVMRQFVRHRTFRLNEVSARYTELDLGFYLPKKWRVQDVKNKQGSLDSDLDHDLISASCDIFYQYAFKAYKDLLDLGVAREQARMVLPLGALTEIIVSIDLSNLIKYFMLRDDNHAQWEHQEIARAMKDITTSCFPWVMEMYNEMQAK